MRFDTTNDNGLTSDIEIYDISTTGALIKNDGSLKKGDNIKINIKFDDVDVNLNAKVVSIKDDKAGIIFLDMPKNIANKILYRYMQAKNTDTEL